METKDYLNYIVHEIHRTIVATVDDEGLPVTLANEKAVYACLNYGESFCPEKIADRSICIDGDIGEVFETQIL